MRSASRRFAIWVLTPEITRFKGLGEISPEEFAHFIGPDMRLEQVTLHKTVMADGVLPRKTFSMGHAQDKRYYIEARKIVK